MAQDAPSLEPLPTRAAAIAVTACGALAAALLAFDVVVFPEEAEAGKHTPLSIAAAVAFALGHALWISFDRRRRGRQVGAWRFFAFLLAPLAVILYLILEYRLRAFLLIPLYLGIVIGTLATGIGASLLLSSLRVPAG